MEAIDQFSTSNSVATDRAKSFAGWLFNLDSKLQEIDPFLMRALTPQEAIKLHFGFFSGIVLNRIEYSYPTTQSLGHTSAM